LDVVPKVSAGGSGTILDLGCGQSPSLPRPFALGAVYIGIDPDLESLRERDPTGIAICADGSRLPIPNGTIDWAVARNVFGDVGLGHRFEDVTGGLGPTEYAVHVSNLLERRASGEVMLLRERIRTYSRQVLQTKVRLLHEVCRVLRPTGGKLVVIETMTPHHARAFFDGLFPAGTVTRSRSRVDVDGHTLRFKEVQKYSQRARYCWPEELQDPSLLVWVFASEDTLLTDTRSEPLHL
jgi:SAM-dependent methyltransferase